MRTFLRCLLAFTFALAGALHLRAPGTYLKIMPSYLPFPAALVAISGAAEIAGGLGVLPRPTRQLAGWGLIALLVAVFPANLSMAINGTEQVGINVARWVWWLRLPWQAVFIWWVYYAALGERK